MSYDSNADPRSDAQRVRDARQREAEIAEQQRAAEATKKFHAKQDKAANLAEPRQGSSRRGR